MKEQNNRTISPNIWFWVLQVVGWGIPAFINQAAQMAVKDDANRYYAISEALLVFVFGIFSTTLLRHYLKKKISFDQFRGREVKIVFIGFVVTSLVFLSSFLLAIPLYKYFYGTSLELSTLLIVSNVLNAFAFIFLWLLFYISIKTARKARQTRMEQLKLQASLKEAELNTLKGQINPHFMFNSLNNIRGLMLEDVEKSREMITRLSEMLRYSLTKNDVDTIALKNELEMVDNYIALSKIQLEDRLQFSSEISPGLREVEIPPMLIQMLIENAVKHGISNEKDGGKIILNISEENQKMLIKVTNTGKLITENDSTKIGLKNIESRLHLLYGSSATFSLSEKDNQVHALIQLPI